MKLRTLTALALLLASPLLASPKDAVVGIDGEVYVARSGNASNLFPGLAGTSDGEFNALAVDISFADGTSRRMGVPHSVGPEFEQNPQLFFEDASGTVFLIWESWKNYIHPSLKLVGLKDGAWSPVVTIQGNRFSPKGAPKLQITRDEYMVPAEDGGTRLQHRTILHLTWWEETGDGDKVLYAPVTLIDGSFPSDSPPTIELNDFDPAADGEGAGLAARLARYPNLQPGRDEASLTAIFANPRSDRVVSFELDVVPGEIVGIGDAARSHIIEIGAHGGGGIQSISSAARSHIIEIGARLDVEPRFARFLADQTRDEILALGDAGDSLEIESLAETARSHIIEIGARMSRPGMERSNSLPATFLEVSLGEVPHGNHLIRLLPIADWAAPELEDGLEPVLYGSADGDELLIAADDENSVRYIETRPEGWSGPRNLTFDDTIDRARAHSILEERARHR
ncbi:MAG: hypothetical protein AAF604_01305 [Acidobacteriota bacterium]